MNKVKVMKIIQMNAQNAKQSLLIDVCCPRYNRDKKFMKCVTCVSGIL